VYYPGDSNQPIPPHNDATYSTLLSRIMRTEISSFGHRPLLATPLCWVSKAHEGLQVKEIGLRFFPGAGLQRETGLEV